MEQTIKRVSCDADTAIYNLETHQQVVAVFFQQKGAQRDAATLGEFDGVAGKVEQRLAQAGGITAQQ